MFSIFLGGILSVIGAAWFLAVSYRTVHLVNTVERIHLSVDSLTAIVAFLGGLVLIALGTTSRLNSKSQKNHSEKDKSISSLLEKVTFLENELKNLKSDSSSNKE